MNIIGGDLMNVRWKKTSPELAVKVIVASCIAALLCWWLPFHPSVNNDFRLPEDTKVILVLQTFSSGYELPLFSRSRLFFLDPQGRQLEQIRLRGAIYGDYLVQHDGNICMFLDNESVIISERQPVKFSDYDENAVVMPKRFGPFLVGHIDSLGLSYAVRHSVGTPDSPEYRNTIRFVADDGSDSYDVFIPYIRDAYYAPERKALVCTLASFEGEIEGCHLTYIELKYDEGLGRFSFDGKIVGLKNDFLPDRSPHGLLVKENFLFHLTLVWNEQEGTYTPVLSKYDLNTGNCVLNQAICEGYSQGGYGNGGYLIGSPDLPVTNKNGKIYLFASNFNVYIIEDENHIDVRPMPYTFKGAVAVSVNAHRNLKASASKTFSDAIVQVGNDGEIYVLIVFSNRNVKIFRLEDEGEYSVFWEGPFPKGVSARLHLSDFEIVKY